jgi:signal recognition particle receptor subunit beta
MNPDDRGNGASERLLVKLVYYGPALSGKTTNLQRLHDLVSPAQRGEMMVLDTRNDRTLFFDLLPLGVRLASGLFIKIKVFTVPGQAQHDGTRKALLAEADGVIFVADSQRAQAVNNGASFDNLGDNLARLGRPLEQMPLVVQFNKRDLTDIEPIDEVQSRWAGSPWAPVVPASALRGDGVLASFRLLIERVFARLDQQHGLAERHSLTSHDLLTLLGCAA